VAEWGRTTLEMIVQDLQRPVVLDESFERRVMVRVRRLYAEKKKRSRGWTAIGATIAHRPAWAALLAAGIVAIATAGVLKARPQHEAITVGGPEPVKFVLVAPGAKSVAVVGDFNNWGLDDSALVATSNQGVWSVTASIPVGVHRYAFVVNGKQWMADPTAPRSSGDDFGMPSSALVVEDSTK
jgi:Glycogen recognition site of AMP-activated protein kinase